MTNIKLIRHNSTINPPNIYNNKVLINIESLLATGLIEGPVLNTKFPSSFSPWFLTGFTEAEGNFYIIVDRNLKI